jgi:hypothetical protein
VYDLGEEMPEPRGTFWGKEYVYGSPEFSQKLSGTIGKSPDFWNAIGDYRTGKGELPSAGYDFLLKSARDEETARFVQFYLDNLRDSMTGPRGKEHVAAPTRLGLEQPGVSGNPGTVGESDEMLRNLLSGSR